MDIDLRSSTEADPQLGNADPQLVKAEVISLLCKSLLGGLCKMQKVNPTNVAIVACVRSNCTCIAHPKHFQQIADISGHFAIPEVLKRKVATIFSAALLFASSVQQMHVTSQICCKVS
jgi:hypothetical protein